MPHSCTVQDDRCPAIPSLPCSFIGGDKVNPPAELTIPCDLLAQDVFLFVYFIFKLEIGGTLV
jgi:hypothetical protein